MFWSYWFYYGWIGKKLIYLQANFHLKILFSFNVAQVIGNIVCWAIIAPILDILIYSEPANKVFTQGILSATLDIIAVGIIGTILLKAYAATQIKKVALKRLI